MVASRRPIAAAIAAGRIPDIDGLVGRDHAARDRRPAQRHSAADDLCKAYDTGWTRAARPDAENTGELRR